ncbi:hypothetical protein Y032_0049g1811 [Ancylostoma ceylanicum]|uniref:Uncharacterized protein n=1 Tax=Ancylostoma ceylanicum TaxID=53326 RepID=A0A016UA73_9BILA|nr:hypothetical protein Y032_0049g1811 [Ancylostoma ceylanicum]
MFFYLRHALSASLVQARRDGADAQSVYLFEKDCTYINIMLDTASENGCFVSISGVSLVHFSCEKDNKTDAVREL